MIRKPAADWNQPEGAAARTARTAVDVASKGAHVARSGGHFLRGLFCFFLAGLWGIAALFGGLLGGSLPTFIGVGAMAAGMAWAGRRAFAKGLQSKSSF
jgi:hypothetical protein